jgi:uncharacterized protein (DUF1800 family)
MAQALVDRLFWRAGFGPSAQNRTDWVGKRQVDLVDWMLNTPVALDPTIPPPLASDGDPIDPNVTDVELELEWIDRMERAVNPLPDRLAFFFHRHWAVSREGAEIPEKFIVAYRNMLLDYTDFGRVGNVTFKQLAYAMTTANSAMSQYLNIYQSVKGKPNENYAREFMELFCLGVVAPDGTPNYSQTDVSELARAFTGWAMITNSSSTDYGKITFTPSRFDMAAKTLFAGNPYTSPTTIAAVTGSTNTSTNPSSLQWGPDCVNKAVDAVLAHGNHAQFLIRKLWAEFIASPIPQNTLDSLVTTYRSSGYQLKSVIRGILTNPLIFESIDEPNLIKPPIVHLVGTLRQFQAPLKGGTMETAMINMQQRIYNPPNVSGWEGGLSWLNTNTVQGRMDLIAKVQTLRYGTGYNATASPPALADVGTTSDDAVTKAWQSVGSPWLAPDTLTALKTYSKNFTATTNAQKFSRFFALQMLILGGPDGQVM